MYNLPAILHERDTRRLGKRGNEHIFGFADLETHGFEGGATAASCVFTDKTFNKFDDVKPFLTLSSEYNETIEEAEHAKFDIRPCATESNIHIIEGLMEYIKEFIDNSAHWVQRGESTNKKTGKTRKVIKRLKNPPLPVIYFHHLKFDISRIKDGIEVLAEKYKGEDIGLKMSLYAGTIMRADCVYRGTRFIIKDTILLLPSSLEDLSKSFLPEEDRKKALPDGRKLKQVGFQPWTVDHREYAVYDVTSLAGILRGFCKELGIDGTSLKTTLPSMAFSIMQKMSNEWKGENGYYDKWKATSIEMDKFYRKLYSGGRIILPTHISILSVGVDTISFDITSSYPYQMTKTLPIDGTPHNRIKGFMDTIKVFPYFVSVTVEDYYPHIPIIKNEHTHGKNRGANYFPQGNVTGWLCDEEHEYLLKQQKRYGFKIQYNETIYWKTHGKLFKSFVDKYYAVKREGDEKNKIVGKNGKSLGLGNAQRTVAKLLLNSSYGKLAQRLEAIMEFFTFGECEGLEDEREERDHMHQNTQIASFITARARAHLYEICGFYGEENIMYTDTDSVKVSLSAYEEKGEFNCGIDPKDLGGWKGEGYYTKLKVRAPKQYSAVVKYSLDGEGEIDVKAKGIPFDSICEVNGATTVDEYKNPDKIKVKQTIHAQMNNLKPCRVKTIVKPLGIKTTLKSGIYAQSMTRHLTNPDSVAAYLFNHETHCYEYLQH